MLSGKKKKTEEKTDGKTGEGTVVCDGRLRHIAFIMDGNGRWAAERGLPRTEGHSAGAAAFRRVLSHCARIGVGHITFYAFSTENWSRPLQEIEKIMSLLSEYIDSAFKEAAENDIRVVFIGDRSRLSGNMRAKMEELERQSSGGKRILNIALSYGSREEITSAVNRLISEGKRKITEQDISSHLYTSLSPDPDLIIRTANEQRLSNFLLWQAAYSEFWFTEKLWPDITDDDVDEAVRAFYSRKRKFGGLV